MPLPLEEHVNGSAPWQDSISTYIIVISKRNYINPQVNLTHLPWTNGRHFADDISRCIFVKEKLSILIKISLTFD